MKTIVALIGFVGLFFTAPTVYAAKVTYTCEELGSFVDSGGQQEKTAVWKIGKPPGYERTFRINWDMYGIPDNLTLKWLSPTGKMTHSTGTVSNTGTYTFTLSARGDQTISIIVNSGGGLSGTAWEYTLLEDGANVRDITLSAYAGSVPHRRILSGTNLSRDEALDFSNFNVVSGSGYAALIPSVYRVVVPANARAFRVKTPPGVYLTVKKGCIPKPGEKVPGQSSANFSEKNVVTFDELGTFPEAGTYYITAAMPLFALQYGNAFPGAMEVDCFLGGRWAQATYKSKLNGETQRILVGVESQGNLNLPASGERLALIGHGRTNSPFDRLAIGAAAGSRWGSAAYYVNWSEGSFDNNFVGAFLDGARFISSTGSQLAKVLAKQGYRSSRGVDYIGHSWGTYIGYSLASSFGDFGRFFALDPAQTGVWYPVGRVNFKGVAKYSMAIWGGGLYGNETLGGRANDSVYLSSSGFLPGTLHEEPVTVMQEILEQSAPGYVNNAFAWNCSATPVDKTERLWLDNKYPVRVLPGAIPTIIRGAYEVQLTTDGSGGISQMRYFNAITKDEVVVP